MQEEKPLNSQRLPPQETEGGKESERQQYPFLLLIKAGSNKGPDLIKKDGTCQEQATDQGELQIKKNPSW